MRNWLRLSSAFAAAVVWVGCGGTECKLDDPSTCSSDQVCESIVGQDKPRCFAPVQLEGKVSDLVSGNAVEKAQVSALDANGSPVTSVAVSDAQGKYTLRIPSTRANTDGTPVAQKVTLRAGAKDYAAFPSGLRVSLPVDTGSAAKKDGVGYVVSGGQADIGLSPLADALKGGSTLSGEVKLSGDQKGALVVAEQSGVGPSAIADNTGKFTIFNVLPGDTQVRAYVKGQNFTPLNLTVEAGKDLSNLVLEASSTPTGTVSGSAQVVATSGQTSVVLIAASTFNSTLVRGEMPPGLRAPDPGTAPNVNGAFSISGVPDGKYVVLAGFENDALVRDPDPGISGTDLVHIDVTDGVVTVEAGLGLAFKVTGAIKIVSPGAGDGLDEITGDPVLTWEPYSSAKNYVIQVFNMLGEEVFNQTQVADTGGNNSITISPAPPAGIYQFRVTALSNADNPLSQTEDLRGMFSLK